MMLVLLARLEWVGLIVPGGRLALLESGYSIGGESCVEAVSQGREFKNPHLRLRHLWTLKLDPFAVSQYVYIRIVLTKSSAVGDP